MKSYEKKINKISSQSKEASRLQTIPEIDPLTATALIANDSINFVATPSSTGGCWRIAQVIWEFKCKV